MSNLDGCLGVSCVGIVIVWFFVQCRCVEIICLFRFWRQVQRLNNDLYKWYHSILTVEGMTGWVTMYMRCTPTGSLEINRTDLYFWQKMWSCILLSLPTAELIVWQCWRLHNALDLFSGKLGAETCYKKKKKRQQTYQINKKTWGFQSEPGIWGHHMPLKWDSRVQNLSGKHSQIVKRLCTHCLTKI